MEVSRRFVRSVSRLFVVLSVELTPSSNKKKGPAGYSQPLYKCRRVREKGKLEDSCVCVRVFVCLRVLVYAFWCVCARNLRDDLSCS